MSDNQTKLGVAPNVGALLCYVPCCVGLIFSIVAVIVEKENKFVRFHAFQSLLICGAGFVTVFAVVVASVVFGMVSGGLGMLISLVNYPLLAAWMLVLIFMMVKAHNNEEYKLPVIGDMASQWV